MRERSVHLVAREPVSCGWSQRTAPPTRARWTSNAGPRELTKRSVHRGHDRGPRAPARLPRAARPARPTGDGPAPHAGHDPGPGLRPRGLRFFRFNIVPCRPRHTGVQGETVLPGTRPLSTLTSPAYTTTQPPTPQPTVVCRAQRAGSYFPSAAATIWRACA